MKHRSLGYIVDHPKRDLPGAIQFARAAAARGCDAYVIPLYDQAVDIPLLPLDAIVVNFARPANFELVKAYRDMGLPVFVLDTEGGNQTVAGSNTPARLAELLKERGFSDLLSGYFFWGPALRDVFADKSGMPADKLFATGCPRFDYASPRWQPALRRPDQGYVLVNSNYPLINPRFSGSLEAERRAMVSAGWEAGYTDRLIEGLQTAFQGFTENVARLARDLPQLEFVYRPHPFENIDFYRNRFDSFPNVRVDGSGDALTAIANARCILHLNCATAVEATMLRQLPISLEYLNTPTLLNHAPLPSNVSQQAHSYEQARDWLADIASAAADFDFEGVHERYVHPWFFLNDGQASDRIVDILLAETGERTHRPHYGKALVSSRSNPRPLQLLHGLIASVAGSLVASRLRALGDRVRRDKNLHASTIAQSLRPLCEAAGQAVPQVAHARHPLTGLPLASIRCHAETHRQ
jgi:surface carbohydrate biosynthesis protein